MKTVDQQPMSDKDSLAGNHVTKLPEMEVLSAQSQQLAAAHAYYLLTSNAHAMQFAAAAHAQTHRRLLNGQHASHIMFIFILYKRRKKTTNKHGRKNLTTFN